LMVTSISLSHWRRYSQTCLKKFRGGGLGYTGATDFILGYNENLPAQNDDQKSTRY